MTRTTIAVRSLCSLYTAVARFFARCVHKAKYREAFARYEQTGLLPIHQRPSLEYLRILTQEVRNLHWRMRIVRENRLHDHGVPLAFPWDQPLPTRDRRFRQVRIYSMRRLLSIHPRASKLDLFLVAASLDLGPPTEAVHTAAGSEASIRDNV
jgi:hypothetical protein